jgi:hypothetical protein
MHGDLDSTQILTQHYGAKSQTVSQLTNSGTIPTRQVPIVQPLQVIKTPADGVGACITPPSDNTDRTVWLHQAITTNLSMEALAPWPSH